MLLPVWRKLHRRFRYWHTTLGAKNNISGFLFHSRRAELVYLSVVGPHHLTSGLMMLTAWWWFPEESSSSSAAVVSTAPSRDGFPFNWSRHGILWEAAYDIRTIGILSHVFPFCVVPAHLHGGRAYKIRHWDKNASRGETMSQVWGVGVVGRVMGALEMWGDCQNGFSKKNSEPARHRGHVPHVGRVFAARARVQADQVARHASDVHPPFRRPQLWNPVHSKRLASERARHSHRSGYGAGVLCGAGGAGIFLCVLLGAGCPADVLCRVCVAGSGMSCRRFV